jgi:hypothetical protein
LNDAIDSFSGSGEEAAREPQDFTAAATSTDAYNRTNNNQDACLYFNKDLQSCLRENASSVSVCQYYMDALKQCREQQQWNN